MKRPLALLQSALASNQVLSLASNVGMAGLSLGIMSLLYRNLSLADNGRWVFFLIATGLFDGFRTGFLSTAFIRLYAGATPARAAEVLGSAWVVALLLTGIGLLLNALAWLPVFQGWTSEAEARLFLTWFGALFLFTMPSFIAASVLQAELRFGNLLALRLLTQGLFLTLLLTLLLTHHLTLTRVVLANLAATGTTSLLALLLGWPRLGHLRHASRAGVRELFHFGKYSVGSYLGSSLLRSSDVFIIRFVLGPAPLAVYNLAQRFLELIELPLRSILAPVIPAMSAAFSQHRPAELVRLFQRNAGLLTWVLAPALLLIIVAADLPVRLVGGPQYAHSAAANLLRIFLALAVLFPIDRFTGVTLDVINQPHLNLIKVFLMLAVNVVGDFALLHYFGNLYGVALASFPTFLTGFFFGYYLLKKTLPISLLGTLRDGWQAGRAQLQALGR